MQLGAIGVSVAIRRLTNEHFQWVKDVVDCI
jgi:hypothetical protein